MVTITIIAAAAAFISALAATLSFYWSKAEKEASVGIQKAKAYFIPPAESPAVEFLGRMQFELKNFGKFKANITSTKIGHIKIAATRFEQAPYTPMSFDLGGGATIDYTHKLKFNTNQAIEFEAFMGNRAQLIGEEIFIITVKYESPFPKFAKAKTLKQGFKFNGISVEALTKEGYEKVKEYVPEEFQLKD